MNGRVAASFLLSLLVASTAYALPNEVAQEGFVTDDDGRPFDGEYDVRIRLFDREAGGEAIFTETHRDVEFSDGLYFLAIGSVEDLPPSLFVENDDVYMAFRIDDGDELAPRIRVRKVMASFVADIAMSVEGPVDATTVSIGGNEVIDGEGRWVGNPAGLRGPAGDAGPAGPAGPAGGRGSPDTPAQVLAKLLQVDGPDSELDADLLDGRQAAQFMRADSDTGTSGALSVQGRGSFGARVTVGGRLETEGRIETESRIVGGSFRVGDRVVIDEQGRWRGSSAGLDADTLDGLDSTDFLRSGDLDELDFDGGTLENVARITPGGDPRRVVFRRTTQNDFQDGGLEEVDTNAAPGSLKLRSAGGAESRAVGEWA